MKKLSPIEQSSKLKVLQDCMDDMDGMMGGNLDAKKKMKATVIASDKKGLEQGLKKAEEVVSGDSEGMEDESMEEMPEEEGVDVAEMLADASPEEIEAQIQELKELLASKSKKTDVKMPF